MTLPAHRFRDREERKKNDDDSRVWCVDYDGTITGAPEQMARIAQGLKALGDRIIVLTGNKAPRADLVKQLGAYGFPFDELIQYHDDGTNGLERAEYLKRLDAWGAFDNRIDRAIILAEVCPHLFLIAEPTDEEKQNAKDADAKGNAKKAAKKLNRMEARGEPRIPPGYGLHGTPETHCGNCDMFNHGLCWGFGNVRVNEAIGKCRNWTPEGYADVDVPDADNDGE